MLCFAPTTLPFLGDKRTWVHRSLGITGINEYTERKTDCFQWKRIASCLRMPSVIRPPAHSLFCLRYAFLLIFFFSTTLQNRPVLEWPLDERLTVTLLVAQYTWKRRGQRADFCLEVSSAFLPGRSEEQKRRCTTPHGCPTPFSHKSVSPEAEKGRRHTANYALWGNLLLYFLMYSLTGGKSLLANTKLTLLPKGASLNY